MHSVQVVVVSLLMIVAAKTNAGRMTQVDLFVTGDGAATFVAKTGLNWLDLQFTWGKSYQEVSSDTTLNGLLDNSWRIATLEEVDTLFTAYGFTPDNGCTNGAHHCSPSGESRGAIGNITKDFNAHSTQAFCGLFTNPNLPRGQVGKAFADQGDSADATTEQGISETYTNPCYGVLLVQDAPEAFVYVEETGLDWLKLSYTLGMSFQSVLNDLTLGGRISSGWRIATLAETDELFTAYGFTPDNGCPNGAMHCSPSSESAGAVSNITSDFDAQSNQAFCGLFSNQNLPSGQVGKAYADRGDTVDATTAQGISTNFTDPCYGVLLVRTHNFEDIPFLPAGFLVGLTALLLAAARKFKLN